VSLQWCKANGIGEATINWLIERGKLRRAARSVQRVNDEAPGEGEP
jgi:hypothetical protein